MMTYAEVIQMLASSFTRDSVFPAAPAAIAAIFGTTARQVEVDSGDLVNILRRLNGGHRAAPSDLAGMPIGGLVADELERRAAAAGAARRARGGASKADRLARNAAKNRSKRLLAKGAATPAEALEMLTAAGWDEPVARAWVEKQPRPMVAVKGSGGGLKLKGEPEVLPAQVEIPAAAHVAVAAKVEITPVAMAEEEEAAGRALAKVITSKGSSEPMPVEAAVAKAVEAVKATSDEEALAFFSSHPEVKIGDAMKALKISMNRARAAKAAAKVEVEAQVTALEEATQQAAKAEPVVVPVEEEEQPGMIGASLAQLKRDAKLAKAPTAAEERKAKASAARAKLAKISGK